MPTTPAEKAPSPVPTAIDATIDDRRRPGRLDAHPSLLPLLRMPSDFDDTAEYDGMAEQVRRLFERDEQLETGKELDDEGGLTAPQGFAIAGSLSLALWSIFALTVGYVLRGIV